MTTWHVMGDSHIDAFRWAAERNLIDDKCKFTQVNGATAVGMRNPNSVTDALKIFEDNLFPINRNIIPVVHLGEVDCGFVIWYRAAKYNESVETQLEASINAYFLFVDSLIIRGYREVVITAGTLPTIRDHINFGNVGNLRREVRQSLAQRTELTLRYNRGLAEEAAKRLLPFIDISADILDPDNRMVADGFRHPNPADHHLDPEKTGPLWAAQLNRLSQQSESST